MAVSVNDRLIRITAAAGQTVFTYDFPILLNTDITILEINGTTGVVTTLTYSVDYTLTGVGADGGGTFVLTSGATLNDIYVAYGNTPYARATDFSGNTEVTTEALNTDYNEGEKQAQQTHTDIDRCIRIPISDDFTNLDTELPVVGDRKGKYLFFNATTGAAEMAAGTQVSNGVIGPASATDNAIALWDGITGDLLKNSSVLVNPGNQVTGVATLEFLSGDGIVDGSGNELLQFGNAASAVNYFFMQNSATANALQFAASGDDANVNMFIISKGNTGKIFLFATPVRVVSNDPTAPGSLVLMEATNNGSDTVGFSAPASLTGSVTWTLPATDGTSGQVLTTDGSANLSFTSNAGGDVTGPASSTDNAIARFDGLTGKLIKDSSVLIDNLSNVTGVATLEFLTGDGIVDGNGNEQMLFTQTGSAVNYLNVTNSATGVGPTLAAAGDDATAELILSSKGLAAIELHGSPVRIRGDSGLTGSLRIYEDPVNGSNYVGLVAPASLGGTTDYILPGADGTTGQTLSTNGTADLSWVTRVAGPGTATDNALARFDSTTGALIKNSGVIVDNSNNMTGTNSIAFANSRGILDANGNETVLYAGAASAVNYFFMQNAATANSLQFAASGDDTNISMIISGKGTGRVILSTPTGTIPLRLALTSNGINFSVPTISADRTITLPDFDVDLNYVGKMIKISSSTASSSASIIFTGLTTAYTAYRIVISNYLPATDATSLYLNVSNDGGSSYDATKNWYSYVKTTTAGSTPTAANSAAQIIMADSISNSSNRAVNMTVDFISPDTGYCGISWNGGGITSGSIAAHYVGHGMNSLSTAIDTLKFISSSGNIASGTFTLYGIRN